MTRDLTPAAQRNLLDGATDGAGTHVCRKCGGHKEAKRLNSSNCGGCERGPVTHKVTVELPPEVMAALAEEAADREPPRTVGEHIAVLVTKRHERRVADTQFPKTRE